MVAPALLRSRWRISRFLRSPNSSGNSIPPGRKLSAYLCLFSAIVNRMIVRMWHGRVPTAKADAYCAFTNGRAIPDYRSVPGNLSVHVLERRDGDVTHFITLTFWDS